MLLRGRVQLVQLLHGDLERLAGLLLHVPAGERAALAEDILRFKFNFVISLIHIREKSV